MDGAPCTGSFHQEVTKPKAIVHTRLNKRRKARCSKLGLGEDDDFSFEQDEKARAAIKPLEKNCSKLPLKKRPLRNNESISVGGHAASTSTGKLTKSPLFKAWRKNVSKQKTSTGVGVGKQDNSKDDMDETASPESEATTKRMEILKSAMANENEAVSAPPSEQVWNDNMDETEGAMDTRGVETDADIMDETASPMCKARTKRREILKSTMANENEAVSAPPSEQVWNDDMDETDGAIDTTGVETDADIMDETASPVCKARRKRMEILKATMANENEAVSAPPSEQVSNDDLDEPDGTMDTTGVETDADIMDETASPVCKARTKRMEILKATMPNENEAVSAPPSEQVSNDHDLDETDGAADTTGVENDGDNDGGADGDPFECVSTFKVYRHGFLCLHCKKTVGVSIDSVSRHLNKHHPELLPGIGSKKELHDRLVATRERLMKNNPALPSGEVVVRYKCSRCGNSFACGNCQAQYFDRHVKRNGIRCVGAIPIRTEYIKTVTGAYVECTRQPVLSRAFTVIPLTQPTIIRLIQQQQQQQQQQQTTSPSADSTTISAAFSFYV